ncbi:unnamed protein product [Euphydryas editha]|uniref:Uncharacterized protein n=1 Tax=Euphydryas editha TaxID=104508 RepID=A0AAU9U4K2_EUPED|nr:unnamed protein product [Euphydryas editha]
MNNLWLLVKWVIKKRLSFEYDVVNISNVITPEKDLCPGKIVYISYKRSAVGRQAEIVLISDDKHFLKEQKMEMDKNIDNLNEHLSKCVSSLQNLAILKGEDNKSRTKSSPMSGPSGLNRTRVRSSNEYNSSLSDIDSNHKAANDHNLVNSTVKYNKKCRRSELNSTVNYQLSRSQNSTCIQNTQKSSPITGPSRVKRTSSSNEYELSSTEIDSREATHDHNLIESTVKYNKRFRRSEPEPRINEQLRRSRNSTPRSNTISRNFKLKFDQGSQTDPTHVNQPTNMLVETYLELANKINSIHRNYFEMSNMIVPSQSNTNSTTRNQTFNAKLWEIQYQSADRKNTSSVKLNLLKQARRLKKRRVFTQIIDNSLPSTSGTPSVKTANNSLPSTLNDPSAETTNESSPTTSNEPSAKTSTNTLPSTSNEPSEQTTDNSSPSMSTESLAKTTNKCLPSTSNEPLAQTTNNSLTLKANDDEEMVTFRGYSVPSRELKDIDWNSPLTALAEFVQITKKKGKAETKQSTDETKMHNTRQRLKNIENQDNVLS